ncbi:MAG TPA: serine/threonine-protein kinase, partial [Verrucomicrobiae bacterium]|nr:serine/threonine-protein kinase [Verrucomicrobiae bacterium]
MDTLKTCQSCGKPLAAATPRGLCPVCLMKVGLGTATGDPTVAQPDAALPSPTEIAPHFPNLEILECLGRGGMGVVYKARQPRLNRFVALKILAPERVADPRFAERFLREAQALARLNHPHIVAVHDFGEVGGLYYLLMEFVDGVSLRALLRDHKITPEQALAIVPKICDALQYAHEQGVVHRDIKPENVLLDKQGRVKIADFGIAKIVGGEQAPQKITQDQQVVGTPHYMAPEQVETPKLVDHRADIYSLGVVFYEMLTGELPLGRFEPPSKRVHVDVRLDEVVLHALEKQPERRYQHASEVKSDVETIVAHPDAGSLEAARKLAAKAKARLRGPAIGLLAAGLLQYALGIALVGFAVPVVTREGGSTGGYAAVGFMAALSLAAAAVVSAGAIRMINLKSYQFSLASSVVAA